MESWSKGAKATMYETSEAYPAFVGPAYYMACDTCGACSELLKDPEYVRRLTIKHVFDIDHSQYERTEPDDDD